MFIILEVVKVFFFYVNKMKMGVASYLLGVALEHQVLLALVQPAFFQCPKVENSVFPLQQLAEDACTKTDTPVWHRPLNCFFFFFFNFLTFDLLFRHPGVPSDLCHSCHADTVARDVGHGHAVAMDVLEEDLCIPAGQGTGLEEGLLLFHVLANQWKQLLWLPLASATPVLLTPVLLLQALQHTTHLGEPEGRYDSSSWRGQWAQEIEVSRSVDLLGCPVERSRGIDQLQSVFNPQHEGLPVQRHCLSAGANCIWVVMAWSKGGIK